MIIYMCAFSVFFFFKQKTAYEMRISDWSSDVCSSDLCQRSCQSAREAAPSKPHSTILPRTLPSDRSCPPHFPPMRNAREGRPAHSRQSPSAAVPSVARCCWWARHLPRASDKERGRESCREEVWQNGYTT